MTWGQPCPVAGTLVSVAKNLYPQLGGPGLRVWAWPGRWAGWPGLQRWSSSHQALPAPSAQHGLSSLRITQ